MILNEIESKIFAMAKPYLGVMQNELHTQEVIQFAWNLLHAAEGDRRIVIPAAILHDVGWSQVPEETWVKARRPGGDPELIKIHEEKGAAIAQKILGAVAYDDTLTQAIVDIIEGHDTRMHARSVDDKIVKDADKLSRFSKSSFFRLPYQREMEPHEICRMLEKKVDEWFFLPVSRKMAREALHARRQEYHLISGHPGE